MSSVGGIEYLEGNRAYGIRGNDGLKHVQVGYGGNNGRQKKPQYYIVGTRVVKLQWLATEIHHRFPI
jgi:hypothetical protein